MGAPTDPNDPPFDWENCCPDIPPVLYMSVIIPNDGRYSGAISQFPAYPCYFSGGLFNDAHDEIAGYATFSPDETNSWIALDTINGQSVSINGQNCWPYGGGVSDDLGYAMFISG